MRRERHEERVAAVNERFDGPCIEIDAEELEAARHDPHVRDLLDRADQYGDSLREQGRL